MSQGVMAGAGRPRVMAGAGRPRVMAGEGRPRVMAGEGRPRVMAGEGRPRVMAGEGRPSTSFFPACNTASRGWPAFAGHDDGDSPLARRDDGDAPFARRDDGDAPFARRDNGEAPLARCDDGEAVRAGKGTAGRSAPRLLLTLLAVLLLLAGALVRPAAAVEPSERLANPKLEARAEAIGATLRCLVCQNESIEESGADLAHDIRVLLRKQLLAGDTDQQAIQAIVSRYGQFVLLKPPVEPATYVLWFAPGGLLLVGFIGTVIWLRRRPHAASATPPLSAAEQRRLDSLLQESEQ